MRCFAYGVLITTAGAFVLFMNAFTGNTNGVLKSVGTLMAILGLLVLALAGLLAKCRHDNAIKEIHQNREGPLA